jgi:hypothetical protein
MMEFIVGGPCEASRAESGLRTPRTPDSADSGAAFVVAGGR